MKARNAAAALALIWALGMTGPAQAATIELISKVDQVPDTFGSSGSPVFSADGRWIAFRSNAPNLVPGQADDNRFHDVFLHDRVTGTTTLVTHSAGSPNQASPGEGVALSLNVSMSADGRYVAFVSVATDLVPGVEDTNGKGDVFLWDRVTDTATLISHAAGAPNVPADGISYGARISADGSHVLFLSLATNLVAGQNEPATPETSDVFLWERSSGTVTLVSGKGGSPTLPANVGSAEAEISGDGGFVVFTSAATDLIPGVTDPYGHLDVFVYERISGTVSLVSNGPFSPCSGPSSDPKISIDGRFIAFVSFACRLVDGQIDIGLPDAFLYDRVTGVMRLASHVASNPVREGGINHLWGLGLSADGRYLVFTSQATNLVHGQVDDNGQNDVFLYDRVSDTTALVSRSPASPRTAAGDASSSPSLSADGRFIAFASFARGLVSGQIDRPIGTADVFLYDRLSESVVLVSHAGSSATTTGNDRSDFPAVSPDGSAVAFSSRATDLGEGELDPFGFDDLFVYSRASGEVALLSHADPETPAVTPHGPSNLGEISADGRYVAFFSRARGLVPPGVEGDDLVGLGEWDVFLRDRATGKTTLVSRPAIAPLNSISLRSPLLSADGRFTTLLLADTNATRYRLLLYDRTTEAWILVNHKPGAATEPSAGTVGSPAISTDGRYVAYACTDCTLVAGQQSGRSDGAHETGVFLYDRVTGTNTLVSHASGSPTTLGNGPSEGVDLSADGRFVAFTSKATNLVAGQVDGFPGTPNVFVFDRTTGAIVLASHRAGQAAVAVGGESPVISANGRFLVFRSFAADLVPGQVDTNGGNDVFLYNRATNTTALASHTGSSATTAGNEESGLAEFADPLLSVDASGRFLVFSSRATDLVAGMTDENNATDVFLYDRVSRALTLISHKEGATCETGNRYAGNPQISADGRRIAFVSAATDLAPGHPANTQASLFLQDRTTGTRARIAPVRSSSNPSANGASLTPSLSSNGRFVAFTSDVSLVPGDFNYEWDVFVHDAGSDGPVTLPPCVLFDTRRAADGPALRSGVRKTLAVRGACGVPATATAVVANVTVPQPRRRGSLRITPGDALLQFQRGQTRTGTFTVPLAADGTLTLQPALAGNGTVHAALEIVGYQ